MGDRLGSPSGAVDFLFPARKFGSNTFVTDVCCQRPYCVEYTRSHPNSEVKRRKARSVLGWGTAREALRVLLAFFLRFSMPFIFWSEMFQILYMFTSYHSPRTPLENSIVAKTVMHSPRTPLENSFLVNQPLPTLAPLGFYQFLFCKLRIQPYNFKFIIERNGINN